ncbi:alpha/beta hydrolase [Qipengyuania sp. CAU 1752]
MADIPERKGRAMGWIGWTLVALAALAVLGFFSWHWAVRSQAVTLLNRVDALATASVVQTSDPIPYGSAAEQVLVVARPADKSQASRPVVLFIHGGSWSMGRAQDYAFVARNLAQQGYVAVSAGYRLVPGGEYPAMLEDGAAATRWVHDHIAEYGGDPSRIFLMGHSAGAYNAVMLALDRRWLDESGVPQGAIAGAIGLAGPYDFLPLDSEGTRNAFGDASDLAATQPINFVRADAPPLLLLTGDADTTVRPRNSVALERAMARVGGAADLRQFAGMNHAGIIMSMSRPFAGDGAVKAAVHDFLARSAHH